MALKKGSVLGSSLRAPIVDKEGKPTFPFLKVLQDLDVRIYNSTNELGQLDGTTAPGAVITSTDNISDGAGSPLAGGRKAYTVLIASSPTTGQVLEWDGTDWVPYTLPAAPVTKIIAGTGITVSPGSGLGDVTVNAIPVAAGYSLGGSLANVVIGAGAGAGATVNSVVGLDGNHQISITTGTGPVLNGVLFTVTFTATRGHTTYPVNKCVVVTVGHNLIDFSTGAGGSATGYVASNTGVDASTLYTWNVSCP